MAFARLLMTSRGVALAASLLLASCVGAKDEPAIAIENAWARSTSAGQTSSAVYLAIANEGAEDRLLSVSSPLGEASIHSTTVEDGIMRMRPLDSLDIPANSTVELAPHGTHIMLAGLKSPVEAGAAVPLVFRFERSGELQINAAARSAHGAMM